jgi:hypothetical protein
MKNAIPARSILQIDFTPRPQEENLVAAALWVSRFTDLELHLLLQAFKSENNGHKTNKISGNLNFRGTVQNKKSKLTWNIEIKFRSMWHCKTGYQTK